SLLESPKTAKQLMIALSTGQSNVSIYLRRLKGRNEIHICGHESSGIGRPLPIWAAGAGVDSQYVPKRHSSPVKSLAERLAEVKMLLQAGHTSRELGEKLHVTRGRAQKLIQTLREQVAVRIIGWRHPGHRGDLAPIYRLGKGEDAPKPRETRAQRYQREKANPEQYERIKMKRRARHHVDQARKKPNGIFGALGV
ncbi:MAG: hypothetical protein ACXVG9_12720, partial [Terriglobales bacterium]